MSKMIIKILDKIKAGLHEVSINADRLHLILSASHPPFKDPRIQWESVYSNNTDAFLCIGLHSDRTKKMSMVLQRKNVVELSAFNNSPLSKNNCLKNIWHKKSLMVQPQILLLKKLLYKSDAYFSKEYGIPSDRINNFRSYCKYFYRSSKILADIGLSFSRISTVIAADLDSLLPALILKAHYGVPVVYDAHETWPEAFCDFSDAEVKFWTDFEGSLLKHVDEQFTVSPVIASYMQDKYKSYFKVLPNCVPLSSSILLEDKPRRTRNSPCIFLYQGNIAKHRGLELLINAWKHTLTDAKLIIRAPITNIDHIEQLKLLSGHLLGQKIFFDAPVTEDELVLKASEAHVGLIPYQPIGMNHLGCCPNKLSQYLAAGLPVISNELPFIRSVIESGQCGVVVDFSKAYDLAAVIDSFANDPKLVERLSLNAHQYFLSEFNWEKQSKVFFDSIRHLSIIIPTSRTVFHYEEGGIKFSKLAGDFAVKILSIIKRKIKGCCTRFILKFNTYGCD